MFAPMRRRLQQLPEDRALKIFSEASAAVLALSSDDYPLRCSRELCCVQWQHFHSRRTDGATRDIDEKASESVSLRD